VVACCRGGRGCRRRWPRARVSWKCFFRTA
jgi:hypothetical protein